MKRSALTFAAVVLVATLAGSLHAADGYSYGGSRHASDHARLGHEAQHRSVTHYNAHQYPQTRFQHAGLHADLNHQAGYAQAQHHAAHDYGTYGPNYGGYSGGYYGGQSGGYYGNQSGGYYGGQSGGYYGNHGISVQTPVGSLWLHH